jgi:Ala-tRNA(Pro) deacylase
MIHIDPVIYRERPHNGERLEKEMRVYDLLEQLHIPFERMDHDETGTIEDCLEVEKMLKIEISKNLFLCNAGETEFYLLLMNGKKKFKTSIVSKEIGSSRLSFAKPEYMEKYLDVTPGSASILGLMNDTAGKVRLLVDEDVAKQDYIGCHPCVNTSSLKIRTADLFEKFLAYTGHELTKVKL